MERMRRIISAYFRRVQYPLNIQLAHHKLKQYGTVITGRVLDIGAGDAPYRHHFSNAKQYVATNTGAHYTPEALAAIEPYTDVWIDGATALPFGAAEFDAVLCFQVLSLLEAPAAFFAEANRVLKDGGALLLTTDFLYPKWDAEDVMRHTDVHLRKLAEAAGFRVVTLESFGGLAGVLYCCTMRYIRDYPQQVKVADRLWLKGYRMGMLLLLLLLVPFMSIGGWLLYLRERHCRDSYAFTMNNLLFCRKQNI